MGKFFFTGWRFSYDTGLGGCAGTICDGSIGVDEVNLVEQPELCVHA